ncbi:IS3 family transposase [Bifidobacterium pullorum]|uniref:IS3 family transposase n=1 Tax=Bifidobacterium pullorum TaxID=78448 RepID=UPI00197AF269|nr:IS3 family transposase [Bifidobacterium pullorum]
MACLLRMAPSSYHYHHARIGVGKYAGLRARVARAFADSKGRYGYRRVKAALGVFCQLGVCRLTVGKLTGLPVVMLPVCRGWACPVGGFWVIA